jgi:hypothetical protein
MSDDSRPDRHLKNGVLVYNERHRRWGQVLKDPIRFKFDTGDPTRILVWDTERGGPTDWPIADLSKVVAKGKVVWEDAGLAAKLERDWQSRELTPPKVVTLKMGRHEAWPVMRALGVAAESDRTAKEDLGPLQWVNDRLGRLLDENFFGVPLPGPAGGQSEPTK